MMEITPRKPNEGQFLLAALAVLILVVVLTVRPWTPGISAVRPDTGERSAALRGEALDGVLGALLMRVYSAFGQEDEAAIYDGLAEAVSPHLLTELYLQRRLAQVTAPPETAGSAVITDVTLNDVTVLARGADHVDARVVWTVTGVLGHEDHRHERVNRYTAELTVGVAGSAWRLTAFDLDQVQREDVPVFLDPFE